MAEVKLIKMRRDSDDFEADVHPNEIDNYKTGGFVCVYDETDAKAHSLIDDYPESEPKARKKVKK